MKSKKECLVDLIKMSQHHDSFVSLHFVQYENHEPVSHETAKANAERVFASVGGEMVHREYEGANSYEIKSGTLDITFSYVPEEEESSTYLEEDVKFDASEIC